MIEKMYRIYDDVRNIYYRAERKQWSAWFDLSDVQSVLATLPSDVYKLHTFNLRRVDTINERVPESHGRLYVLYDKATGDLYNPNPKTVRQDGNVCWFGYSNCERVKRKTPKHDIAMFSYRKHDRKFVLEKFLEQNDK